MEYAIGDKIVYPMHGAGVIEAIEEQEFLGKKQKYYIMRLPLMDMKVMIPIATVKEIGIRYIIDNDEVEDLLSDLKNQDPDVNNNWNKRYRENMLRLKSGDIHDVAQVVKVLMCREKYKGLSTGERKMLNTAKQILLSEIVMVKKLEQDAAEELIRNNIFSEE